MTDRRDLAMAVERSIRQRDDVGSVSAWVNGDTISVEVDVDD